MLGNTNVRVEIKHWLPCGVHDMSVSSCVGSEVDFTLARPLVRCYAEVEYEKYLLTLVLHFDRQQVPEIVWSLFVLPRPFRLSVICPRVGDSVRRSIETVFPMPSSSIVTSLGWTVSSLYNRDTCRSRF